MAEKKEEEKKEPEVPEEETKEPESSSSLADKDYEDEIAAEEAREKARKLEAEAGFQERKVKREEKEEGKEEDDEDKPLTKREARELMSSIATQTSKTLSEQQALALARSLSGSDLEARAVIAKWKNRTFPTNVPLQEQIEEMHAAVNRKRILAKDAEVKRAIQGRETASNDAVGTYRDAPKGGEPKLSAADASAYRQAGFEWDGTKRLFKKPINKGKLHVWKDPKSGKTWAS